MVKARSTFPTLEQLVPILNISSGIRVKYVISLTGVRANKFADDCGIARASIWAWESRSSIAKTSAKRLSVALERYDIECSPDWILQGGHTIPYHKNQKKHEDTLLQFASGLIGKQLNQVQMAAQMRNEIDAFLNENIDAFLYEMQDASMYPVAETGDLLGGIKTEPSIIRQEPENAEGYYILKLRDERLLFRLVHLDENAIKIAAINENYQEKDKFEVVSYNKLEYISNVCWLRRKPMANKNS